MMPTTAGLVDPRRRLEQHVDRWLVAADRGIVGKADRGRGRMSGDRHVPAARGDQDLVGENEITLGRLLDRQSEQERSSRSAKTPVNWASMCWTTRIGGMGAVRSGRTWLSACGPPVEIPITRQIRADGEADGLVVDGSAGLSGRSAGAGLGRAVSLGLLRPFRIVSSVSYLSKETWYGESAGPALGGGQDLGDQQVGAGTHLGELVALGLGHEVNRAQLQRLERDIGPFLGQRADHDHRRLVGGQEQRAGPPGPRPRASRRRA